MELVDQPIAIKQPNQRKLNMRLTSCWSQYNAVAWPNKYNCQKDKQKEKHKNE